MTNARDPSSRRPPSPAPTTTPLPFPQSISGATRGQDVVAGPQDTNSVARHIALLLHRFVSLDRPGRSRPPPRLSLAARHNEHELAGSHASDISDRCTACAAPLPKRNASEEEAFMHALLAHAERARLRRSSTPHDPVPAEPPAMGLWPSIKI